MSVRVSPGGLSGLIMQITEELKQGKSQDEILSKYPVTKTALPYLLTLQEEYSKMFLDFVIEEFSPLEEENIALKEQIKQLESQKGHCKGLDTQDLQNELKRLEIENKQLQEYITELKTERDALRTELADLRMDVESCQRDLKRYEDFFQVNSFCLFFYRLFLKKAIK